jgi:hypothetical protein
MTPDTKLYTERELILMRDELSLEERKAQTKLCMEIHGMVFYRYLFMIMGYTHAFNDKWYKKV